MGAGEEELLKTVEEIAQKAFVLFELADTRLQTWQHLASAAATNSSLAPALRRSSSSSINSEVINLRQQETAAGEAVVLLMKALSFIAKGIQAIQRFRESYQTCASPDLNESRSHRAYAGIQADRLVVQWLRARFNECYEKIEFAKSKTIEELPFVDKLVHDRAKDIVRRHLGPSSVQRPEADSQSRQAALAELGKEYVIAESGYESSLWLLQTLLDDIMWDGRKVRDEDKEIIDQRQSSGRCNRG
jgi:serine/threonine-protein kinase ULK/ATG1